MAAHVSYRTTIPLLLLILASRSIAELVETWKFGATNAPSISVINELQGAFDYTPTNRQASCLHEHIEFHSDVAWSRESARELIAKVMANACCDVTFEGLEYTLRPAEHPNQLCLRGRKVLPSRCYPSVGHGTTFSGGSDINGNNPHGQVERTFEIQCRPE